MHAPRSGQAVLERVSAGCFEPLRRLRRGSEIVRVDRHRVARHHSSLAAPRAEGWLGRLGLTVCTLLLLLVASCGRKETEVARNDGVAIVVPVQEASWVRNFNPLMRNQARWPAPAGIYEPLLIYNVVTGEYVPWLASHYEWRANNTELWFRLRENVHWSDGKLFTAKDAEFTFNLIKKHSALDQDGVWDKIASVHAHDSKTLVVKFKHAFVPALYDIGHQPIVPEHIWKDIKDPVTFANPDPVGTGPFTEVRYFKTQVYELGRNPNYWQPGKPKLKGLRVPAYPSNDQSNLALIHGEIDWGGSFVPAIERIFVSKDPEHHGFFYPPVEGTVMLYANTKRAPFDDVRVRKGISMAIDRKKIVRVAMHNYTKVADATALSDMYAKWRDPSVLEAGDWTRFDPEAAKALLDEAGLKVGPEGFRTKPDGSAFSVDINCVTGWSDWILAAQIMVRNLKSLGIQTRLKTYAFGAWFQKLQLGDFDLSMSWSNAGPTPHSYYERQMSSRTLVKLGDAATYNWQRFSSARADELLAKFERTSDFEEQKRLSTELQREFVKHAPAIPLFPGPSWGQYNTKRVTGFPSKENPYAALSPYAQPGYLLVLVELEPREN